MRVDYDQVAPTYNRRYEANPLSGVAETLRSLVGRVHARRVLEVGCGTGRWLEELSTGDRQVFGLDRSRGMLSEAQQRRGKPGLACGQAWELPFPEQIFDLIYCVHAFHHFEQKETFIRSAHRALRPDGVLAIIGMDPHSGRDRYYLYDYFETTLETDLRRFPSSETIAGWMTTAGFTRVEGGLADWIDESFIGEAIWQDTFLEKSATSQLTLLSDELYQSGLERIRQALAAASQAGEEIVFQADIEVVIVSGVR